MIPKLPPPVFLLSHAQYGVKKPCRSTHLLDSITKPQRARVGFFSVVLTELYLQHVQESTISVQQGGERNWV